MFVSVSVAVKVTDAPAVPAAALLDSVELLVMTIRCAGVCEVVPLELPLLVPPEEELLLELLLELPLDEDPLAVRENLLPPPPHAARPKENRTAAQALAII